MKTKADFWKWLKHAVNANPQFTSKHFPKYLRGSEWITRRTIHVDRRTYQHDIPTGARIRILQDPSPADRYLAVEELLDETALVRDIDFGSDTWKNRPERVMNTHYVPIDAVDARMIMPPPSFFMVRNEFRGRWEKVNSTGLYHIWKSWNGVIDWYTRLNKLDQFSIHRIQIDINHEVESATKMELPEWWLNRVKRLRDLNINLGHRLSMEEGKQEAITILTKSATFRSGNQKLLYGRKPNDNLFFPSKKEVTFHAKAASAVREKLIKGDDILFFDFRDRKSQAEEAVQAGARGGCAGEGVLQHG